MAAGRTDKAVDDGSHRGQEIGADQYRDQQDHGQHQTDPVQYGVRLADFGLLCHLFFSSSNSIKPVKSGPMFCVDSIVADCDTIGVFFAQAAVFEAYFAVLPLDRANFVVILYKYNRAFFVQIAAQQKSLPLWGKVDAATVVSMAAPQGSRVDDEHRFLHCRGGFHICPRVVSAAAILTTSAAVKSAP